MVRAAFLIADFAALVPLVVLACLARYLPKRVDVGLGATPLINVPYHKKAVECFGYSAESFVDSTWHTTDNFDIRPDKILRGPLRPLIPYVLMARALFRYRCLIVYFSGGALRWTSLLVLLEPPLLRLAKVRTIVLPFGADVAELTRTPNFLFRHGMANDYPGHRHSRASVVSRIDAWTRWADHIIAGADWVDYLYYWDTLMLGHFAIDTNAYQPSSVDGEQPAQADRPLRLLHAPNHRQLKGTEKILNAVRELQAEGMNIEIEVIEGRSAADVQTAIETADVIVDQLVIGWYAMFAIEGMAMGKPVICFLRDDLKTLFTQTDLIEPGQLPLIEATVTTIKDVLADLENRRVELAEVGRRSRAFVEQYHSLEAIGGVFDGILRDLGIEPTGERRQRSNR